MNPGKDHFSPGLSAVLLPETSLGLGTVPSVLTIYVGHVQHE